ncbi:hypothetical protein VTL71DRAFT_9055 [Oculimacula yallundae]|uniref:Uncharacterized protein n=1 Tax=Oculimacula yallundae TaxID=86028 RepID=A0ABR4BTM7_9HELO
MMDLADQNLLQFADGSLAMTSGSIHARWIFPRTIGSESFSLFVDFHILRGCPHSVILGQDILDETDAFSKHEDCFVELDSETDTFGLNLVIWASRKKKAPAAAEFGHAAAPRIEPSWAEHEELQKRAMADRRIGRMRNSDAKTAALSDEMTRRQEYDSRMENQTSPLDSDSTRTSSTSENRAKRTAPVTDSQPPT